MISTLATTGYDTQDLNYDLKATFYEGCRYIHTDYSDRFIPRSSYMVKIKNQTCYLYVDYIDPIANEKPTKKSDCKWELYLDNQFLASGNMKQLDIVVTNISNTIRLLAK